MNSSFDQHTQEAVLNLPPVGLTGQKHSVACFFQEMRGKRLILASQERPPVSAAVSIQCNDALFLGEVISSAPEKNGYWRAEVKVEQVLTGLQSLITLRERLLGESAGQTVAPSLARMCA